MKTLILTPNKNEMCGMYQLAKDLAKELNADIRTKEDKLLYEDLYDKKYKEVITFLYPMHKHGRYLKKYFNLTWICYDQGIPPVTKVYFSNFWRRQYMKVFNKLNIWSMKGADEYWDIKTTWQKPRWTKKHIFQKGLQHCIYQNIDITKPYTIYLGRTTDYKNFRWLKNLMKDLNIPLLHPENVADEYIWQFLSHSKILITASLWEGYGRPVMEAEDSGIPAVSYDVGTHKQNTKRGICVSLDINNIQKSEEEFKKAIVKIWNREVNNNE